MLISNFIQSIIFHNNVTLLATFTLSNLSALWHLEPLATRNLNSLGGSDNNLGYCSKPDSHWELCCVSKLQVSCLALQNWIHFLGSQCICCARYYLVGLCLRIPGFPPWFLSPSPFWSHSICKVCALTFTLLLAYATDPIERLLYIFSLCVAVYISQLPLVHSSAFTALETVWTWERHLALRHTAPVSGNVAFVMCFINNIFFLGTVIARRRTCQVLPPFHS